jgi:DNA-binding IclR family transcriptional regulator
MAVWWMHSEGSTYVEIARALGLHKSTVLKIVHRFEEIMLAVKP